MIRFVNYNRQGQNSVVMINDDILEQELEFIDKLLLDDIRNNSAWNQRFFVVQHTTGWTVEVVTREVGNTN